jgi:4-diphosphocytidyl-2-C-methyl-D-erythritol kinase
VDKLTLKSYAKLNLYLKVLNKRKDNYHSIQTIFERISLFDTIAFKPRRDNKIKIACDSPQVPRGSANLAFRSAKLLQDSLNIKKGVDIKIEKRIPVAAGLGGGSSNAATVLTGLNKLWGLGLSCRRLVQLGSKIGSDVPFFIYNCRFARGSGRGDEVTPLKALKASKLWHVLAVPRIRVSTPLIYKRRDKDKKATLTKPVYGVKILTSALLENDLPLISRALFNGLEAVTAKLYPEVNRLKGELLLLGAKSILMSGSGPAVFAIVSSRKEAVFLGRQLKKGMRWQVFVAKTV